ncbi:PKD domain-containing protein [Flavihumibacter sp. UBA7668]|uniref:PKD domain-containing protein n=1 Tax=Flavihumibacter sp. UBA7668 TaxID=1946542 RepID=UPI0025C6555E|nr:PKD domain-containing protein [Flavihumibacter sp. UBA7668]
MKNRFACYLALAMFAITILSACRKDADFISDPVEGPEPQASFTHNSGTLQISFTNTSQNGDTYYWQFGDGGSSTEASPVHSYAVPGKYEVKLKVNSAAGYAAVFNKEVIASSPATADFAIASSFGTNLVFQNTSTAVESVLWDFGDNSTSTELNPDHAFPDFGTYTVRLTVTGLLGDEISTEKEIEVKDMNLLKGGGFESGDETHWQNWASQNNNPPQFGYTGDKPAGAYGAALRFPSFSNSGGSTNQLIYQAVQVEAGKKYKLSAQVKIPSGASQAYFQFYISTDANTWVENNTSAANHFLVINSWHGWGALNNSTAFNGSLLDIANKSYGFGATSGGVYTATETRTVFIGIQAGTWQGKSNGDWLLDNMSFVELP